MNYEQFLKTKQLPDDMYGFEPSLIPDFLFPFQKSQVQWGQQKGRCTLMQWPGMGKSIQEMVWAENCIRKTGKPALILTPLAVSHQFVREAKKFGLVCKRSEQGEIHKGLNVTNYERLKYFKPEKFGCIVGDDLGILKGFDNTSRRQVTDFMLAIPYRLIATATPAPNDYMELGTLSEAVGNMSRNQMLGMFFTNDGETTQQWNLKGHARRRFWGWVATWARALRKPSDLGPEYSDDGFDLPPLKNHQYVIKSSASDGEFFASEAVTLDEQRSEQRKTLRERCQTVADLIPKGRQFLCWCHLNDEGDYLKKIIPGAVQVRGGDPDDFKERTFADFADGKIACLITKPKIAGHGLNFQNCADMAYFPSHSFEMYFQAIRRCHRFGQKRQVNVHIVSSESQSRILLNMERKERQAISMYDGIVRNVNQWAEAKKEKTPLQRMELPSWLRN